MKRIAPMLVLLLLAACNNTPSGTYAALEKNGDVAKQENGQPKFTLALDDGTAVMRGDDGEAEMAEYKVVDGTLFLIEAGKSKPMQFTVEGDLLVATGELAGLRLKQL